ncbi:hypothetical protein BV25DRAFT_166171 [Artomyces pyxidatus]|uniref:Uncharacterized protein n=1 Tax=Artomyces pyxidatus TaxID=48021 RepID=A0ACB8SGN3_9AGAM|nr:hypothetical protein BV25DRAFT_166171 [Artomyces pyxidatus]
MPSLETSVFVEAIPLSTPIGNERIVRMSRALRYLILCGDITDCTQLLRCLEFSTEVTVALDVSPRDALFIHDFQRTINNLALYVRGSNPPRHPILKLSVEQPVEDDGELYMEAWRGVNGLVDYSGIPDTFVTFTYWSSKEAFDWTNVAVIRAVCAAFTSTQLQQTVIEIDMGEREWGADTWAELLGPAVESVRAVMAYNQSAVALCYALGTSIPLFLPQLSCLGLGGIIFEEAWEVDMIDFGEEYGQLELGEAQPLWLERRAEKGAELRELQVYDSSWEDEELERLRDEPPEVTIRRCETEDVMAGEWQQDSP